MINDELVLCMPFRTCYGYINHGDDPCVSEVFDFATNELLVFASRNIRQGEELLDKYNLDKHIDLLGGFKGVIK
jgi:hypothetical protein